MTQQDVLNKAIKEALGNGWVPKFGHGKNRKVKTVIANIKVTNNHRYKWIEFKSVDRKYVEFKTIPEVVFDYNFAKALWGEDRVKHSDIYPHDEWNASEILHDIAWQYHLQQMVIADDPIEYLGEHLND